MDKKIQEVIKTIQKKERLSEQLKSIEDNLKNKFSELGISVFESCDYETLKSLKSDAERYMGYVRFRAEYEPVMEAKKAEIYQQLKRPTYYPEIDTLEGIPLHEKLKLDKSARMNHKYYMKADNCKNFPYPLTVQELELLCDLGIAKRHYQFRCRNCMSDVIHIEESELKLHKRAWELQEKENKEELTEQEAEEYAELYDNGYESINICSCSCDSDDYEITCQEELDEYMEQFSELIYCISKQPDLTFEKL